MGFKGRKPRLVACGSRGNVFDRFRVAHPARGDAYVAMWIDSEEPLNDAQKLWDHLKRHGGWEKPAGAVDEQVLFMTTCMETWIVADRAALREHYGSSLQEKVLPPMDNLERRSRDDVQERLELSRCRGRHERTV